MTGTMYALRDRPTARFEKVNIRRAVMHRAQPSARIEIHVGGGRERRDEREKEGRGEGGEGGSWGMKCPSVAPRAMYPSIPMAPSHYNESVGRRACSSTVTNYRCSGWMSRPRVSHHVHRRPEPRARTELAAHSQRTAVAIPRMTPVVVI